MSNACATFILLMGSVMGLFLLWNGIFLFMINTKSTPLANWENPGYRDGVCTSLEARTELIRFFGRNETKIIRLWDFLTFRYLTPYLSALDFCNSLKYCVWCARYFPTLNWIFLPVVACKIQVWNRLKIQFI